MKTEKREALMASDDLFLNNLVLRLVKDQLQNEGICLLSLPEPQPMSAEQEQLLEQVADVIRDIFDSFGQNPEFNEMVDMFARVVDRQNFQRVLDSLFADKINWGCIVTVICLIGRIAKIHPNSIPSIVSWTQDYFRDNLLNWIWSRGGWISSITFLVNYTIEQNFGSSSRLISLYCGVIFISGVLLGGLIIWRLNRGS